MIKVKLSPKINQGFIGFSPETFSVAAHHQALGRALITLTHYKAANIEYEYSGAELAV